MNKKLRMGDKVMSRKLMKKEAKLVKSVAKGNGNNGLHLGLKVVKWGLSVNVNPARPEKLWNEHEMSAKAGRWMKPLLVVAMWKRNGASVNLKQWSMELPSKHVNEVNAMWGDSHAWVGTKAWEKAQVKDNETL